MNKLKKVFKNPETKWINIFLRDICLLILIIYINYSTRFILIMGWWIGLLTGMFFVWISWQFTDYLKYKKILKWKSTTTES